MLNSKLCFFGKEFSLFEKDWGWRLALVYRLQVARLNKRDYFIELRRTL
jgi:hypothetical protein